MTVHPFPPVPGVPSGAPDAHMTFAAKSVLRNLFFGWEPWGQMGGSAAATLDMMRRKGWLTAENELTESGAAIAAKVAGLGTIDDHHLARLVTAHANPFVVTLLENESKKRGASKLSRRAS